MFYGPWNLVQGIEINVRDTKINPFKSRHEKHSCPCIKALNTSYLLLNFKNYTWTWLFALLFFYLYDQGIRWSFKISGISHLLAICIDFCDAQRISSINRTNPFLAVTDTKHNLVRLCVTSITLRIHLEPSCRMIRAYPPHVNRNSTKKGLLTCMALHQKVIF